VAEVDERALTLAHKAVEDVLIEFRDSGIGVLGRANGFVVRHKDGTDSPIMRLGTRDGLRIGIRAYLEALAASPATGGEAARVAPPNQSVDLVEPEGGETP